MAGWLAGWTHAFMTFLANFKGSVQLGAFVQGSETTYGSED